MPIYEYKALNDKGHAASGILDADTPKEARDKLRRQRLFVTDIRAVSVQEARIKKSFLPELRRGKRLAELSMVTRQLATLLTSGIPIAQALTAVIEQSAGTRPEAVFRDVREQIVQGRMFAEALANHPGYFSDLYVNMVKAGEATGTLDVTLQRLAEYIQSQNRLRQRISAAMAYPVMMMFIGVGVVSYLMLKVVPNITRLLEDQGQDLPAVTQVLIGISSFFQGYWWLMILAVAAVFTTFKLWVATDSGRRNWDQFKLRIPGFGDLYRKISVSRFAITFSTLLKSGIPALEALRIVQHVVGNQVLSDTLVDVHDRILEGTDISTPLKKSGVFPPVVGYMIAIGEQSGRLEDLLDRISEAYDEEVELAMQKFTAMLEPVMIVAMAGAVGFIVAAIMIPLLQLTRSIK